MKSIEYGELTSVAAMGFPFMPRTSALGYMDWPKLTDLFPQSFPGVKTSRDPFLVDIDRDRLERRIDDYLDPKLDDDQVTRKYPVVMSQTARFDAWGARRHLLQRNERLGSIVRYCYRPFDLRWLYWEPETKLLDEKRSDYVPHVHEGNIWMSSGQRSRKSEFYQPQVTTRLADHHIVESNVGMFPLWLFITAPSDLFEELDDEVPARLDETRRYNLSDDSIDYLAQIGSVQENAADLFHHVIAVLHSPAYCQENAGALRQDWPRVPLPESREELVASGELGHRLAALLNPEAPVPRVTVGELRPELRVIGPVRKANGGQLDPEGGDLELTAGWGYAGARGVTMPGRGRAEERPYSEEEREALESGAAPLGLSTEEVLGLLGESTYDVYLNELAYWSCVPARVWEYTLGGYQVIKKWLSYREKELLGRSLEVEEIREVTHIARRIAAILLLGPGLDADYRRVCRGS